MVLISDFKFLFVTCTPFSALFAVDVETAQSKRTMSFSALFNLTNRTIIFFVLFLLIFLEDGRPATINCVHPSLYLFSKKRKYMNVSISSSKKEHVFSRILSSSCFFIINVTHAKALVLLFLSDKIGWSKNNRHIYLQYTILYMYMKNKKMSTLCGWISRFWKRYDQNDKKTLNSEK